jgi:uncharacterized protein (TIGR03083 family)
MSPHAETITVLQSECERLTQYLAALPAAAWTTPSACTDWEVRDVVAHLIRAAELYRQWITRGRQGETSPPEGRLAPGTFQTASPAERQQMGTAAAQRAIALRERLGSTVRDVFRTTWDHHNQLVASLSAHEWHTPCYYPLGLHPLHTLVHAAIFELATHSWDIRSVLEPSARLSPDALPVMPTYFAACLGWFFRPGPRLPTAVRYRCAFTDAHSSVWDIAVAGDTAHRAPAVASTPAQVTFGCEVETFALLMCGRTRLDRAMGARHLRAEGDPAWVQAFTQWF